MSSMSGSLHVGAPAEDCPDGTFNKSLPALTPFITLFQLTDYYILSLLDLHLMCRGGPPKLIFHQAQWLNDGPMQHGSYAVHS